MTKNMWFNYLLSVIISIRCINSQDLNDRIIFMDNNTRFENDSCENKYDNTVGRCVNVYNCNTKTEEVLLKIIEICSYNKTIPIICCPLDDIIINNEGSSTEVNIPNNINLPPAVTKIIKSEAIQTARISVTKCTDYVTAGIPDGLTTSVVGGDLTIPGEFPHMASIGFGKNNIFSWYCAGSIISETFILTAAHCKTLNKESPTTVRLGDKDIVANDLGIDYTIESFIVHPNYNRLSKYNDIGLIKVNSSIDFFFNIRPACLWQTSNINYTEATATGWGHTEFGGSSSANLLKVSLDIFQNDFCSQYYPSGTDLSKGLVNDQVCAGKLTGGKDTCQGDSGGPIGIEIRDRRNMHHIIGITSFGINCGSKVPSIYTRVSSYVDWIESIVWPAI